MQQRIPRTRLLAGLVVALAGVGLAACAGPGHRLAFEQLDEPHQGPVLALQGYVVRGDGARLRERWRHVAGLMARKPGFLRAELSPGIGPRSNLWIAVAYWKSLDDLRRAFADPEVRAAEQTLPAQEFVHLFAPTCRTSPTASRCW